MRFFDNLVMAAIAYEQLVERQAQVRTGGGRFSTSDGDHQPRNSIWVLAGIITGLLVAQPITVGLILNCRICSSAANALCRSPPALLSALAAIFG